MGHDRVAATLNTEGWAFRDRWGWPREWTGDDVRRVLLAWPIYAGKVTIGRVKDGVEEVIDGAHDPILDLDLIDRVVAVLEKRMGKRGVPYCGEKRANYLLGGLLYCAECGKKMQGNWQRGRATYRHRLRGDCPAEGQVDADALDRHALEVVREALKFDDDRPDTAAMGAAPVFSHNSGGWPGPPAGDAWLKCPGLDSNQHA